ncbi:hypothetical protein LY76DRAFT_645573 [Colletotrichum caudatum]|nr:hypothetical protein LY76DRAFT_645573 [Colletotrichum caudatum]
MDEADEHDGTAATPLNMDPEDLELVSDDDRDSGIGMDDDPDEAPDEEPDEAPNEAPDEATLDQWDTSSLNETNLGQGMDIASRKVSASNLSTVPETNLYDCVRIFNIRGHFRDRKSLIKKASTYVKPGGRLVIQGFNLKLQDEHGKPPDDANPAHRLFKSTLRAEVTEHNDPPSDDEPQHGRMMVNAGLSYVKGETRLTPINSWPTESHAKNLGTVAGEIILMSLEDWCYRPFMEDGHSDPPKLLECAISRKSLKDPNNRLYVGFSIVEGEKPLNSRKRAAQGGDGIEPASRRVARGSPL